MMFDFNVFTGEMIQRQPENFNFGPWTHFDCGFLNKLDEQFDKIDCDELPVCCNKRRIDLGAIDECGD